VNKTGDALTGTYNFNGGWQNDGLTISDGNVFAQTLYVYNLTSLSVSTLNVNGSIIPTTGFDDTFDIGSTALRWKDLHLSGEVFSNGTEDNYFLGKLGIGTYSPFSNLEVYGVAGTDPKIVFSDGDMDNGLSGVAANFPTDAVGVFYAEHSSDGGFTILGMSGSTATGQAALRFLGIVGNETPDGSEPVIKLTANKGDGAGNFQALGATDYLLGVTNQDNTHLFQIFGGGNVNITRGNLSVMGGGFVGIGTEFPGLELDVVGDINVTAGNITIQENNRICLDNSSCDHYIFFNGTHTVIE